jgi:hypothetical protein
VYLRSQLSLEKRKGLFRKFQESLDSLNQDTGIGLCVCQNLIDLMHGEIVLDEKYESGMVGFPGSRFAIKLNTPALVLDSINLEKSDSLIRTKPASPRMIVFLSVINHLLSYLRNCLSCSWTTTCFFGNCPLDPFES